MMKKITVILAAAAIMAACGTSKQATTTKTTQQQTVATATAAKPIDYVRRINDNAVYTKNIVAKADFSINASGRDLSVSGRLAMRRDEVIRLQLSPFGLMEVGRLEFTPEYVLLINRMNKEYVKATYNDVDFLSANGLDFYTLQAIFWNELFLPGHKQLSDTDLGQFSVGQTEGDTRQITFDKSRLGFNWTTEVARALITHALFTYDKGTQRASTVNVDYSDFVPMGSKRYPSNQKVTFDSKQMRTGKMVLQFTLSGISNDGKWDARTTVSDKYTKITPEQFVSRLGSM